MFKHFQTITDRGQHCIIIDMPIHYVRVYGLCGAHAVPMRCPCCVQAGHPVLHFE